MSYWPPSDEGGGKIFDFDGGREVKEYNKYNIPLAKTLRKNMTLWERKLQREPTKLAKVEEKIISKAITKGGLHFYEIADAMQLIDILEEKKIQVLGVDGFTVSDNETIPHMEHSIDLSNKTDSHSKARAFLESKNDLNLVFEVVY